MYVCKYNKLRTEINSIACQFPDQKYERFSYAWQWGKVFSLKFSNGGKWQVWPEKWVKAQLG